MEKTVIKAQEDDAGTRLDRFLKRIYKNLTQSAIEKAIRKSLIRVNDKKPQSNQRLEKNDIVKVASIFLEVPSTKKVKLKPKITAKQIELLKQTIIHIDDDIIVINKPAGIATQGGTKIKLSIDDFLEHFKFGLPEKPKLVHRLDKETSGVLLLARNNYTATKLTEFFRVKSINKTYWAIVVGKPKKLNGKINIALQRKESEQLEQALTYYKVINTNLALSWLELQPITGKMHQIRIHCKELGCPILGDRKYGTRISVENIEKDKLYLHARQIIIEDFRGKKLEFIAEPPIYMSDAIKNLF